MGANVEIGTLRAIHPGGEGNSISSAHLLNGASNGPLFDSEGNFAHKLNEKLSALVINVFFFLQFPIAIYEMRRFFEIQPYQ